MKSLRTIALLASIAMVSNVGCFGGDDDDDGGSGPSAGDWNMTITASICGAAALEIYNDTVTIDDSDEGIESGFENAGYECANLVVDGGNVTIDCSYTTDYPADPGCQVTYDLVGDGTYTDTSFEYTYTLNYSCNASCSFICTVLENCTDVYTITGTKL